jgi:hypothetical protein
MEMIQKFAAPEMAEKYLVNNRADILNVVRRTAGAYTRPLFGST